MEGSKFFLDCVRFLTQRRHRIIESFSPSGNITSPPRQPPPKKTVPTQHLYTLKFCGQKKTVEVYVFLGLTATKTSCKMMFESFWIGNISVKNSGFLCYWMKPFVGCPWDPGEGYVHGMKEWILNVRCALVKRYQVEDPSKKYDC